MVRSPQYPDHSVHNHYGPFYHTDMPVITQKMSDMYNIVLSSPAAHRRSLEAINAGINVLEPLRFGGVTWMYTPNLNMTSELNIPCEPPDFFIDDELSDSVLHQLLDTQEQDPLDTNIRHVHDEAALTHVKQELPTTTPEQQSIASTRISVPQSHTAPNSGYTKKVRKGQATLRRRTVSASSTEPIKKSSSRKQVPSLIHRNTTASAVSSLVNPIHSTASLLHTKRVEHNPNSPNLISKLPTPMPCHRIQVKLEHKSVECRNESDEISDEARKVAKLEKNRQSARECRKRKKEYIGDLEEKASAYIAMNDTLRSKLSDVEQHNVRLAKEVEELRAKLNMSPIKADTPQEAKEDKHRDATV